MQSRVLAILIAVVLALVATVAMVVYVNGADRRAVADQKPVWVFVAKEPIKAGTSGEDAQNGGKIDRVAVASASAVDGRVFSLNQLKGRFAAVDIVQGEQLLLRRWVGSADVAGRRLLPIPENYQALSIALDAQRQVAGFVTPGDRVSMLVTRPREGRGEATQFLLQNVPVLAVGTTALANAASQGGGRVNQGKGSQSLTAITLAIKEQYVELVVHAAEQASIYLTLMPPNADPAARSAKGVDDANDIPQELE